MSKKCRKEHVQIHTNVEQMSLKLVEYRVHVMLSRDRTYFCPQTLETQLMTRRTTLFFTTRSADKIRVISEVNARLDSSSTFARDLNWHGNSKPL